MPSSRRFFTDYNPANYFDIMLQDVKSEQLKEFSKRLGANEFESVEPSTKLFPTKGLILGSSTHRMFVNLAVAYNSENSAKTLWVPFFIDSGSPWNFMSTRTMNALGVNPPRDTTFSIHGYDDIVVYVSPVKSHFEDINVIGGDFFHHTSIVMLPLYHKRAIYLFQNEQMVMEWISKN
jgi:hypothetical protein